MDQDSQINPPFTGKWLLVLAAGVFIINTLWFCTRDLGDLSGDSARFLLLGRALAGGHGFVEMERPGMPAHTEYGPGLPLLLAPALFVSPSSILPGKLLIYLSLAVYLYFFFRLVRATGTASAPAACMLTLVLASIPHLYRFANQILSDLPYAAMSLAALYYLYLQLNKEESPEPKPWVIAGLLMAAAFFFRQVGVALFAGAVIGVVLKKKYSARDRARAAVFLSIGFLLPVGAWLLRNYLAAGALDPSHAGKLFMARDADPFAGSIGLFGLVSRAVRGFVNYFRETAGLLLDLSWPFAPKPLRLIVSIVALAPALYGFVLRILDRRGPMEFYFFLYMVLICAWQSHNPRYLLPVLPLAFMFAARGLSGLFGEKSTRLPIAALIIAVGFNVFVFITDALMISRAPVTVVEKQEIAWGRWFQYGDWVNRRDPEAMAMGWHRMIAASAWMRDNLPEDSLVMARKRRLVAYYSERKAVQYVPETRPEAFTQALHDMGVTHLLVDEVSPGVRKLLGIYMDEQPEALAPVFTFGRTHVMAVR
jgi:hypothetical protein